MGFGESLLTAFFVIFVVFLVLVVLWLLIRAFSVLIGVFEGRGKTVGGNGGA
ncbi:MAG: hypothetical protein LBH63_04020 [Clostridiales Family XIII bacterium]|nr:hypothetical protein [Clostridiales Family XIII bacterium]